MKKGSTIAKIIAAVVCVAGVVFLVATYGDKLVALAKKLLPGKKDEIIDAEEETEGTEEEVVEEVVEEVAEEAAEEEAPVAEEVDFVG